ncbi:hypothetical protein E3N88_28818 [Mikania micrantha]|uniref:phosphatidylglycerophosphatase n=1 Tax=Mikania micrantha TaxID=192012 RepID=A0A5N6N1P8_9ASTR|nr:hypothetical protein E3N88_28818 [Mikania micrantha]
MRIEYLDDSSDMKNDRQIVGYSFSRYVVTVDAKRALVGAGARILFYPTLLYNVCRNKIQAEFRWWDQIDQFLLLGAVPFPKDVHRLKQLGVCGVITLNEPFETLVPSSLYQSHGIEHLIIPTRDYLFAPLFVDIDRAVNFIHRNATSCKTTYVHCKAGRSTTIVLCYLVEFKHMTPASALEYVQSRRPRVLLAPSQWKVIQEYKQWRLASTATPSADAVLITKADLEGLTNKKSILVFLAFLEGDCVNVHDVDHTPETPRFNERMLEHEHERVPGSQWKQVVAYGG